MRWRDKHVISLLSTNTPPSVVPGQRKCVVPVDAIKKPDVVTVYNCGMNRGDVSDQSRS